MTDPRALGDEGEAAAYSGPEDTPAGDGEAAIERNPMQPEVHEHDPRALIRALGDVLSYMTPVADGDRLTVHVDPITQDRLATWRRIFHEQDTPTVAPPLRPSSLARCASALERLCGLFDVGPRNEPSSRSARWTDADYTPQSGDVTPPDGYAYGGFALAQAFQEWARRIEWSSAAWSELTEPERRDYVAIVTGIEDRADEIRRGSQRCCAADDVAREADPETFSGHSAWCTHDTHLHGERCVLSCACGRGKVMQR